MLDLDLVARTCARRDRDRDGDGAGRHGGGGVLGGGSLCFCAARQEAAVRLLHDLGSPAASVQGCAKGERPNDAVANEAVTESVDIPAPITRASGKNRRMVTYAHGHVEVGMAPVGLIDTHHAQLIVWNAVQHDLAAVGQRALVRDHHPAELAVQARPYEWLQIVRHHLHHTLGLVSRL